MSVKRQHTTISNGILVQMPNTKLTSVKSEVKYEFQVILGLDLPSLKG